MLHSKKNFESWHAMHGGFAHTASIQRIQQGYDLRPPRTVLRNTSSEITF